MSGYSATATADEAASDEAAGEKSVMLGAQQAGQCGATALAAGGQCWPLKRRVVLALMGHLMWALCYADRTNISLAIVPMSAERGYSDSMQGLILSSFFVGYVCTQVLGGWLALQVGGKPVLAVAVAVWSIATLLTPLAASAGTTVLLAARVLMGLGEGMALPVRKTRKSNTVSTLL